MADTNPAGYVDRNNSAPLNQQPYGSINPWQTTSVLVGTVWISQDTSAKYIYYTNTSP